MSKKTRKRQPATQSGSWSGSQGSAQQLPKVKIVDATPTWESIIPWYLAVLEDGTEKSKKIAREELTRMARVADKYVTYVAGTEREPEDTRPQRKG